MTNNISISNVVSNINELLKFLKEETGITFKLQLLNVLLSDEEIEYHIHLEHKTLPNRRFTSYNDFRLYVYGMIDGHKKKEVK